jgi:hypothetical protein
MHHNLSAYLNDLHQFDPVSAAWTDLSAVTTTDVPPPYPRFGAGLAAVGGMLYVFGGEGYSGDLLQ